MQLNCDHCGKPFAVSVEQLGTSGPCPHCGQTVHLPPPDEPEEVLHGPGPLAHWLSNSISAFASLIFHMALMLILALITVGGDGLVGEGEEVFIGNLPGNSLDDAQDDQLDASDEGEEESAMEELDDLEEIKPPTEAVASADLADVAIGPPSASGGDSSEFSIGGPSGAGPGGGQGWDGHLRQLQRNGLDIVIVFDSTGSMSGEINQVKSQIARINKTLFRLVPKTRISICTYRDRGEDYVVRGLPLSSEPQEIEGYLRDIYASGGGDHPEAVQEGLRWAVDSNEFRGKARKVILVFGDAPPHREDVQTCMEIASDFNRKENGVVSTVTCRARRPMSEFADIADAGGGEAFLTVDQRQIMKQLMILVFGSRYRSKVMEAFELMDLE